MKTFTKLALMAATAAVVGHASAQVVFYENEGFQGRSFTTQNPVPNFQRYGFNNQASSVVVVNGRWEACEERAFEGRCRVLRPGRYPSLSAIGLNNQISSVRQVSVDARIDDGRFAPVHEPVYDNRRRPNERLYDAQVTSVRAVMGTPQQRCWVERQQVRNNGTIVAPIAGAVLGGVLGHQVGGGSGKDIATVGGAVAGAAIGSHVGNRGTREQDVQRCETVPNQAPQYWDVTYQFRGQTHSVQTTTPPGRTIRVNQLGEPRS